MAHSPTPSHSQLVPTQVAADACGVSIWTIRRAITRGHLTGYRYGPKLIRVNLTEALGMFSVVPTVGTITPTGAVVPVPERKRHHGTQSRDGGAA